jgi:hypothetical protein
MRATYRVTMESGETWIMRADFAQATSPITHLDDEGTEHSTIYQVAAACHSPVRAAEMLAEYWGAQSGDHDQVVSVECDDEQEGGR